MWCYVAGVVEEPERAQLLHSMAEVALNGSGSARLAPLEPAEPLAPAGAVCALARDGPATALAGGDKRALRLAADAASRSALPLLFVDPAPANATWEALELYPHPEVLAQVR